MFERLIQLLSCEFLVRTNVEPIVAWLDRVRPSAVQDWPVSSTHTLEVVQANGEFALRADQHDPQVALTFDEALGFVERRLHELAFGALGAYTKLHAGCGAWRGRRFLLVGAKGAGKTTLTSRLLFEGCAIEGDEMVLLDGRHATAYPRRFGLRLRTLNLVPQIGALAPDLLTRPDANVSGGFHVLALDPAQLGLAWRIAPGPVDAIFHLTPRHHGPSKVVRCPSYTMAQLVTEQSAPPDSGAGDWLRHVSGLVDQAHSYELTVGDLDSAVEAVRQCLTTS